MFKKTVFLMCLIFLVGCGSSKSVVRTAKKPKAATKPFVKTTNTSPTRTVNNTKELNAHQKVEEPEILEATSSVKVTTQMVLDYISTFKETAKDNMRNHGVPASITLAQAILESGVGQGTLSQKANNHFGIKCHKEWTGPSVRYDDDSEKECFRKYSHASESFRDHSLFLTSRGWYADLFKLDIDDYKNWAKGLKAAGYATDPKYPIKLISLIERYELYQYDNEVIKGNNYVPKPKNASTSNDNLKIKEHIVAQGDTLYSISRKFNVSVDDIKKKNKISGNSISIGQKIIIN